MKRVLSANIIILLFVILMGATWARAQSSITDQSTPSALSKGSHPLGSYGGSKPPVAPTNLRTTNVSAMQVGLLWNDNSDNETGFVLERDTNGFGDNRIFKSYAEVYAISFGLHALNETEIESIKSLNVNWVMK